MIIQQSTTHQILYVFINSFKIVNFILFTFANEVEIN